MLFSIKSENLTLASRSRDYMRKSTIENLKTCQPREQNMQLSFDKRCSFPTQNSAFSLGQTRLMSGKLSRLKSKHTRKNRHASGLNENGSKLPRFTTRATFTRDKFNFSLSKTLFGE